MPTAFLFHSDRGYAKRGIAEKTGLQCLPDALILRPVLFKPCTGHVNLPAFSNNQLANRNHPLNEQAACRSGYTGSAGKNPEDAIHYFLCALRNAEESLAAGCSPIVPPIVRMLDDPSNAFGTLWPHRWADDSNRDAPVCTIRQAGCRNGLFKLSSWIGCCAAALWRTPSRP